MADKQWVVDIAGTEEPSTNEAGRLKTTILATLTAVGKSYPATTKGGSYDAMPTDAWAQIKAKWEPHLKRLEKLGLSPAPLTGTQVFHLVGTVADGLTRKMNKVLREAEKDVEDWGDVEAQKRGRSSRDHFDDDGKHKHGK